MSATEVTPPAALQAAAVRFLQRFGLVAAAWTTLLAATEPGGVDDPDLLVAGVVVVWVWALASQFVGRPRVWWAGWFVVAIGLELLGPLVGTDGTTLVGGVSFLVITGAALGGQRWYVAATVAVLSTTALLRPAINDRWTTAGSISTVLLFVFGGLAITWLVEAVIRAQVERERLTQQLASAERERAVARERAEAAARLHDSVLQTLTAIARADDAAEATRLSSRAAAELRDFLRRADGSARADDLGGLLRERVTTVADGGRVGVSVVGSHPVDVAGEALVDAAAEAVRNALDHGRPPVRVLLEADGEELVCWVADRGDGFDPDEVPADRLGVRRSIVGRVEAVGGSAVLSCEHGCEWRLAVPA